MGSKDKAIKQKYGVLGYCEKNGESHEILNTVDNVIRCSSCLCFRPVETSQIKTKTERTKGKTKYTGLQSQGVIP